MTRHGQAFGQVVRLACLLALLALLTGCAVSRQQVRKAHAVIAAAQPAHTRCTRADHCAQSSPFLAQAHKALAASTPEHPVHYLTLLDVGENALAARLNLIRAARQSIDLQTYIWANDDAGKLVLDALVRAARRGVKVRVLADQLFSFPSVEQLARLARTSANLKLRLYNPTFDDAETSLLQFGAGLACCFSRFNQRMHNKLLLIDDAVGITGGRNYEDRYFGWDPKFNFRDRDVIVAGPAAREMADTFKIFWSHPRSVPLTALNDVNRRILADGPAAPGWTTPHYKRPAYVTRVRKQAENSDWLQRQLLAHSLKVGRVDYFSDYPDKTDQPHRRKAHEFTLHIMRMVAGAKKQIVLQTPYLVLSDRAQHLFTLLHHGTHPPRVIVSTNSLASTDTSFSYAITYKHLKRFLKDFGFEIYAYKPHPADRADAITPPPEAQHAPTAKQASSVAREPAARQLQRHPLRPGARRQPAPLTTKGIRVGMHAKSIEIDGRFAMVGTHNFDPRSAHYNTESGVIVYSPRFAAAVRTQILIDTQPKNAWTIAPRQQNIPLISPLNEAISTVSAHLPWFDLWPFRYATNFELKPGCRPLAPAAPGFYQCYQSVGDFPGVDLPFKTIYTRMITGFGFGLSGVL
jgi:phosphatidylserine/phosphatidylglycerophosphate/cardiolipin synthase-like enzyme